MKRGNLLRHLHAHGCALLRFADDGVLGFEHEADAQRYLQEVRDRLAEFSLALHPEKTKLIETR
ncbi:maturase reverse transcriptase, partial [mine drainage metagenome]